MILAWEKHGHFWDNNRDDQSGFFCNLNVIAEVLIIETKSNTTGPR